VAKKTKPPKPVDPMDKIVVASNRRANHEYEILDTYEAGLVLQGSEVKALREAKVQIAESYARIRNNELWLLSFHISPYSHTGAHTGHDPDRPKKLLLHRTEINRIDARLDRDPLTMVALQVYFIKGNAKVELALARRKNQTDKRQSIAEKDAKRETARAMKAANRVGYDD